MILLGQKRKYDEFLSGEVELIKSDLKRMKLTGDATDSADEPKQPSSPRGDGLFKKRYTFDTPMRQRVLNLSDNWGVTKTSEATGIAPSNIKRWKREGPSRKTGSGRKVTYPDLDSALVS